MPTPAGVDTPLARVIVVVADGLRPDVIPLLDLPAIGRLAREGAANLRARTVSPSVTAAAMGSLLTGAEPGRHGLVSSRFRVPQPAGVLHPLPRVLHEAGIPSAAWMATLPLLYRRLGRVLARRLGFGAVTFAGSDSMGIVDAARPALQRARGLILLHFPDADQAGHHSGWPSPSYLRAARRIDHCIAMIDDLTGASADPGTLLIVLADHGGGGVSRRDHREEHPLNRTIPIILAGGRVAPMMLLPDTSLLDVPATVLFALGVSIPDSYGGRPLREAFSGAHSPTRDSVEHAGTGVVPIKYAGAH